MDQLDLFSTNLEAVAAEGEEILLVKLRTNETRYRSLVKIGEGVFYKEVLVEPPFPKGHDMYIADYCREVCKKCLKCGHISELRLDKRWKRCEVHGWIDKTKG